VSIFTPNVINPIETFFIPISIGLTYISFSCNFLLILELTLRWMMTIATTHNNNLVSDFRELAFTLNPELSELANLIRIQQEKGNLISVNKQALTAAVWLLANASSLNIFETLGLDINGQDWQNLCRVLLSNVQIASSDESKNYYDSVASNYDELYTDGISLAENAIVANLLNQYLT
jgi:hypothetical protein